MTESQNLGASEVFHDVARERFELRFGQALCALEYRRTPGKIVIYHTEVPEPIEGQGLAAQMTRAALEFARSENLKVEPRCPYTAAFMQKNPEFNDLLAPR
jgi:hypothetical protein